MRGNVGLVALLVLLLPPGLGTTTGSDPSPVAQTAMDAILADLKQEIVNGSVQPAPTPAPGVTLYLPASPANVLPQTSGTPAPGPAGTAVIPNLIRRSLRDDPLAQATPPAPAFRAVTTAASAVNSTTDPSANGRSINLARWNSHYLIPRHDASTTAIDGTPISPLAGDPTGFTPPDWVMVTSSGPKVLTTPDQTTVGRYAYAIYDEGGLLDANVAGYPRLSPTPPEAPVPPYKSALAFADLTALPLPQSQVDNLVGWRNYASAQPGGSFGSYFFDAAATRRYYDSVLANANGFLSVSDAPPFNGQTDQRFNSRQDLLRYRLATGLSQNALQYLGTFTRGLNQPSHFPVSRADPTIPRPLILPSAQGGNNVGDNYPSASDQDLFSPSFLTLRAQAAFTRSDGTTPAAVGEPLVNKRFALQRLAWLTYKGPSATRSQADPDIQSLITNYGVPWSYLQKGTATAIQNYFGLTWDASKNAWRYNVHNRGGATGAIRRLDEVAALGTREPDFLELLKASIDPGSLGKASTNGPMADPNGGSLAPLNFQYQRDISLDAALVQIAVNLIDQADVDGYPTCILFDDGSGRPAREFRGVENLPYLYRFRTGVLKARDSLPAATQPSGNGDVPTLHSMKLIPPSTTVTYPPPAGYPANPLKDTGVGVLLTVPDVWNPHDQNGPLGTPRPGASDNIRLIANSATPDVLAAGGAENSVNVGGSVLSDPAHGRYKGTSYNSASVGGGGAVSPASVTPNAPIFSRTPTPNGAGGTPVTGGAGLTGANGGYMNPHPINPTHSSVLTFQVPDAGVFREPTMLARPGGPYSLSMTLTNPDAVGLRDNAGAAVLFGDGFRSHATASNPLGLPAAPAATQAYVGIYLGVFPLKWVGSRWSGSDTNSSGWVYTDLYGAYSGNPVGGITYRLQYQDPSGNWVTYDEKYLDTDVSWMLANTGQLNQPGSGAWAYVDPRTSRLGSADEANIADGKHYRAPVVASNWLDATSGAVVTERPGIQSGFGSNFRGRYNNTQSSPSVDWGFYTAPGWHYKNIGNDTAGIGANSIFFQSGLFAQNDPTFGSDGYRFPGDTGNPVIPPGEGQFYSDPDGVVRRAMGAYVTSSDTVGQPLATASDFSNGESIPASQSQSRPFILNRPFRSVGDLGCVFSGTPWKNLDFSTPESGFSALLDAFCVAETGDANGLVAGRVNLNTRQAPVLQAVLAGAYRDEATASTMNSADAAAIAKLLVARTSTAPAAGPNVALGPQPLQNVGELTGRWNGKRTLTGSYTPPLNASHNVDGSQSHDGFSQDLGTLTTESKSTRLREASVRALVSVGNTRVWNLMIDVIAQTGSFPAEATRLDEFTVNGEQRYWLHVAIDRFTGQVIDQSVEAVDETPPTALALSNASVAEEKAAGTPVGTLSVPNPNSLSFHRYALVSGSGDDDNAAFAIAGGSLRTATVLRYLDKASYRVRVRVSDQNGQSFEQSFTVTVSPSPYTQWKIDRFGAQANDATVAGDLVDADGDGMVNLVEYTRGTFPLTADGPGTSVQREGNTIRFNYPRRSLATDVTAHVYWNADLLNAGGWTTDGLTETMLSDDGNLQQWQATLPMGTNQRAFLRLQVTRP